MSLTINSSQSSSIANRALSNVSRAMDRALAKLSSGSRVASARDDAASLAIGSRIKAEIAALKTYQQNATQGVSMLQIAEGTYQRAQEMLMRMRSLAAQAQSGNLSATERGMLDTEYQQIKNEITRLARSTNFNGTNLFAAASTISFQDSNTYFTTPALAPSSGLGIPYSADLNGDGKMDFVSYNYDTNTVFYLAGDGNGGFSSTQTVIATLSGVNGYSRVKFGDFNGDGLTDVLTDDTTASTTLLFTNNGSGGFTQTYSVAGSGTDIAIGDFNGDGRTDFAKIGGGIGNYQLFTNTGSSFTSTTIATGLTGLVGLKAGDINNDGTMDLIVYTTGRRVVSMLNNGNGSFSAGTATGILSGNVWNNGTLADINGDGILDLLVGDNATTNLYAVYGSGNGNWGTVQTIAAGIAVGTAGFDLDISVQDLNADGYVDIMFSSLNDVNVRLIRGTGIGTFAASQVLFSGYASFADLNNDGRIDILGTDDSLRGFGSLNTTTMGLESSIRVSSVASSANNISFRTGSILLNSLDNQLAFSNIGSKGGAKRSEESIIRAMNMLSRFRTAVGATINRLEATQTNIATMIENQEGARSAYLDLDVASEMAQYTAQKVTMQAGISMLAQASSTQRLIAQLLQSGGLN